MAGGNFADLFDPFDESTKKPDTETGSVEVAEKKPESEKKAAADAPKQRSDVFKEEESLPDDIADQIEEQEKELKKAGKLNRSKEEQKKAVVVVKKHRNRRPGRNMEMSHKEGSIGLDMSFPHMELYRDREDLDENRFILEGKVDRIFKPENNAVMFLNIEVKNPVTGKLNYPQVCIFRKNIHIADGIKLGDYVRVYGRISATVRNTEKEHYTKSNFYIYRITKPRPPVQNKGFLSRFGLEDDNQERQTNRCVVSGVVEDVRIKTNSCIQFILRSRFDERGGGTVKFVYYADNKGAALDIIEVGKRIAVIGYLQTGKKVGKDGKATYVRQLSAQQVSSMIADVRSMVSDMD